MIKDLISKVWAKIKRYVILGVIIVLGLFGFKECRKIQKKQDKQASSTVLPPNAKEKIVVDPVKHEIDIIKPNGDVQKGYLPDRPTQIIENKDGTITVIDHKFGTEIKPYLGVGGALDSTPRVQLGLDLLYFHRFDLGLGVDSDPAKFSDTRTNLNLSYNFYSNTSLAVSIDNHHVPGLFIKVRF